MKSLLTLGGVVALILVVLIIVKSPQDNTSSVSENTGGQNQTQGGNASSGGGNATQQPSIVFDVSDINPGGRSIEIDRIQVTAPVFVVIKENAGGAPGAVIGVSQLVGPGLVVQIPIELDRETRNNDILYAYLHRDNGNRTFNAGDDAPLLDSNGKAVVRTFFADVATGNQQ